MRDYILEKSGQAVTERSAREEIARQLGGKLTVWENLGYDVLAEESDEFPTSATEMADKILSWLLAHERFHELLVDGPCPSSHVLDVDGRAPEIK